MKAASANSHATGGGARDKAVDKAKEVRKNAADKNERYHDLTTLPARKRARRENKTPAMNVHDRRFYFSELLGTN